MKLFITFSLVYLFCFFSVCIGQQSNTAVRASNITWQYAQAGGMGQGQIIAGLSTAESLEVEGDPYWDNHWGISSILLYKSDKLIEGFSTRYDIHQNEFQFNLKEGVKVLQGSLVKNLVWIDSVDHRTRILVNGNQFLENDTRPYGFLEQLVDGDRPLLKKIRLEVLKPNFNPALNVGSKNVKLVKHEQFYFVLDKTLYKIKSRKDIEHLFVIHMDAFRAFVKANEIKFKSESDLIKVFYFYNSLENL